MGCLQAAYETYAVDLGRIDTVWGRTCEGEEGVPLDARGIGKNNRANAKEWLKQGGLPRPGSQSLTLRVG